MTEIPTWFFITLAALSVFALLDRFILPGMKWFFHRKINVVIDEINKRLQVKIPTFNLTKRQVLIDRLVYDPKVLTIVDDYALENKLPRGVVIKRVEKYAREIVPYFNVWFYFRIGSWICKSIIRILYRVRLGYSDEEGLKQISPNSSVVFIINHRSNMDYILVAYLALNKMAMSFAVGEWARVWPIQQLVKALGAFFVRRNSGDPLYRSVLARYVQMATENGVVQAIFPEGGLSLDGHLRKPKCGLLDYMLRNFSINEDRDIVFIPVGVNYDRVFEDRSLLLKLRKDAPQRSRFYAMKRTLGFILHNFWLMVKGGWYRFGYAIANFGSPLSIKDYVRDKKIDFKKMDKEKRIRIVEQVANDLMDSVKKSIPVVPVALIATIFRQNFNTPLSDLEIKAKAQEIITAIERKGSKIYLPRSDRDYMVEVGMRMLVLRHIVLKEDGLYRANPDEKPILSYYANSIADML